MNTKIWLEELSFGPNFRNLRAIGCNRVWCYFLLHAFKIKKFESISSNGSRDIAKSLKISFGFSFVSLRAFGSKFWQFRFRVYTFQTKKTALYYLTRFWVFVYITSRTDGQKFFGNFYFFLLIKNIYTCLYLSRLFFKFHPHSDQS